MNINLSFFIPTTKHEYLERTITSLLNQTNSNFNVMLLDNSENENVVKIFEKIVGKDKRFKYEKTPIKLGIGDPTENWNYGLNLIDSDYFVLIGDDDTIAPNFVAEMFFIIKKYPNCNIYRSKVATIDESDNITRLGIILPEFETWDEYMYYRNTYSRIQSTTEFCVRTKSLKAQGGYQPLPYAIGSDDITYLRLMQSGPVISTNKTTAYWRRHGRNLSMLIPHKLREKSISLLIGYELDIIDSNNTFSIPIELLKKSVLNQKKGHIYIRRQFFRLYRYRLIRPIINFLIKIGLIPPL